MKIIKFTLLALIIFSCTNDQDDSIYSRDCIILKSGKRVTYFAGNNSTLTLYLYEHIYDDENRIIKKINYFQDNTGFNSTLTLESKDSILYDNIGRVKETFNIKSYYPNSYSRDIFLYENSQMIPYKRISYSYSEHFGQEIEVSHEDIFYNNSNQIQKTVSIPTFLKDGVLHFVDSKLSIPDIG